VALGGRMIKKVVIPAAGLGTRLYPATKNQPKEMLPLPVYENGKIVSKPALQIIFEQFYNLGCRDFCFVVGTSKEAIIRHFTPEEEKLEKVKEKEDLYESLKEFYQKLYASQITYVVQSRPLGFGDAILQAKKFVGDEDFWVIAGDTIIVSNQDKYSHFKQLERVHEEYKPAVTLSLERVENPINYGVVDGEIIKANLVRIRGAVEKPSKPPTNLAITALYIFSPEIFSALEKARRKEKELELTWGIDILSKERSVYGVILGKGEKRYDIGASDLYFKVVQELYRLATKKIQLI